jgi:hypothetical protein
MRVNKRVKRREYSYKFEREKEREWKKSLEQCWFIWLCCYRTDNTKGRGEATFYQL